MKAWRIDPAHLHDLRVAVGLTLPAGAGVLLFGWRAAGTMALIMIGALLARTVLASLRTWPAPLGRLSLTIQSVLLALFCPPTWCDPDIAGFGAHARWPLALGMGMTLTLSTWLIARMGSARASPVVITLLLALATLPQQMHSDRVLQREDILKGDLLDPRSTFRPTYTAEPWLAAERVNDSPSYTVFPAAERLDGFLHGRFSADRPAVTIPRLVSDDLPPLEDLVIGGHAASIGAGSAIVVVIGGLFLVHRRVVAFRVPGLMLLTCLLMLVLLPTPLVVTKDETVREWIAASDGRVGWAAGLTFVNYLLMSSPALLVIFFLACQPGVRPMGGRAATTFAILFGTLCGAAIMLISVQHGPLLAVAAAQLATPTLERRLPQRPTV